MKETKNLLSAWKADVQWNTKTLKQKMIACWFGLSWVALVVAAGNGWYIIPAIVNLVLAAYFCIKYVPIEEGGEL